MFVPLCTGDYCDVYLTHDSTSGEFAFLSLPKLFLELQQAHTIPFINRTVRKDHNTGRNHLQNVRDYYLSLDPAQNEAIHAHVMREYELRGLPHPVFTYQPPGGGAGYGGGGGEDHIRLRSVCLPILMLTH
jgi:hypothetical protein